MVALVQFPFFAKLFADSACARSIFHTVLAKVPPNLKAEIAKRSDRARLRAITQAFDRRRTIAWFSCWPPNGQYQDNLNTMLLLSSNSSILLRLRKLCNP
jgi:hypothetical protein